MLKLWLFGSYMVEGFHAARRLAETNRMTLDLEVYANKFFADCLRVKLTPKEEADNPQKCAISWMGEPPARSEHRSRVAYWDWTSSQLIRASILLP